MKAVLALALLTLGSSPSLAAAKLPITIHTSGEGKYELWCKVTPTSGDETTRYLEPGRDTFSTTNFRSAACSYKASPKGAMTVSIDGAAWTCPFTGGPDGKCEKEIPKATFGNFTIKPKPR